MIKLKILPTISGRKSKVAQKPKLDGYARIWVKKNNVCGNKSGTKVLGVKVVFMLQHYIKYFFISLTLLL